MSQTEKIRAENAAYTRAWRARNPHHPVRRADSAQGRVKRRVQHPNAIPIWRDQKKINAIYKARPQGVEVDHVVPLNGKTVCGLHVHNNLQYLTHDANMEKAHAD